MFIIRYGTSGNVLLNFGTLNPYQNTESGSYIGDRKNRTQKTDGHSGVVKSTLTTSSIQTSVNT